MAKKLLFFILFCIVEFLKEVSSAHQGAIYFIKNTVKREILWNIITGNFFYIYLKNAIYSCDGRDKFSILLQIYLMSLNWISDFFFYSLPDCIYPFNAMHWHLHVKYDISVIYRNS